jgi:hypothetical protein
MGAPDAFGLGIRRASRRWKANSEPDALTKFQLISPNFGHGRPRGAGALVSAHPGPIFLWRFAI